MKILFLNNFNYLRGGSERVLFEEMRLLREVGHEVAVYSRSHERNEPSRFQSFFPPQLDLEQPGLSLKALRTAGELIYSRDSRAGLREVLARFRPDLVHAHNIYGRLSLSVLDELKQRGVPVALTLHDLKLLCPSYLMLDRGSVCERCKGHRYHEAVLRRCHRGSLPASLVYALESWLNHGLGKYRSVSRFIAPSRFVREKCLEYGWPGEKVAYLPNFAPKLPEREREGGRGEYLLYAGRLSGEKGVGTLIEACRRLRRPVPLLIAGDGPLRAALEREAAQAGVPATFAGHLGAEALREALEGARGVVVPSQWYENAPLSVLEALAAGTPVLGARIGGIPELVAEGENGLLFEPGDPGDLAAALERFLSLSDAGLASLGEGARRRAQLEFSEERHLAGLLEIYRQLMNL